MPKACATDFMNLYQFSGVARVPCALGQEIFLRPPSTKPAEFEVKNRYKCMEKAKHRLALLCSFLRVMKRI